VFGHVAAEGDFGVVRKQKFLRADQVEQWP